MPGLGLADVVPGLGLGALVSNLLVSKLGLGELAVGAVGEAAGCLVLVPAKPSHRAGRTVAPMTKAEVEALRAAVAAQMPDVVHQLKTLVRIESFASPDGPGEQVAASAAQVAAMARATGLPGVEVVWAKDATGRPGAPAVIGRKAAASGAPTVLLYAHHDVQPVAGDWSTDPFEPVVKDGRLIGRGSADDGGGVVAHLAALRVLGQDTAVGVALLIEGEEESASPTLARLMAENAKVLAADVAVVADSDNWSYQVPALTTSLRGVVEVHVTVRVASFPSHSGYGGPVMDAGVILARLVASLHDERGDVAVAGLEQTGQSQLDLPEDQYREVTGLLDSVPLVGSGSIADQTWHQAAIDLVGFDAPRRAEVSNVILPQATAVISLRVPPGKPVDTAAAALTRHLEAQPRFGAELEIEVAATGDGFLADLSGPGAQAAEWALAEAFGTPPVHLGVGGSIPLASLLSQAMAPIEVLLTGVLDPASRPHSSDESVSLDLLEKAILAEVLLLRRLGETALGG